MHTIDINCDMGEGIGPHNGFELDSALMSYVSSVNIACAFHAGSPSIMQNTVRAAVRQGVAIGAHPGFPDKEHFGRRALPLTAKEVYQLTLYQIGALDAFVRAEKASLHHVKPHGALYNMAAADFQLALAIAQAIADFNPQLILYGLSGSQLIAAGLQVGLPVAREVFADRTYQPDGSLTPRNKPNGVITEADVAINQAISMVLGQLVSSTDGTPVHITAETLCIHGDGEQALLFAKSIHNRFQKRGIKVQAIAANR